ncbi:NAD(P)-binding protein [Rhodobacteraceae bacterium]|nr:NAD(P)-binding protein [Paracoccaceae bacterium]
MKQKVVIVGSGFRGFCDALQLLNRSDIEVTIVDSAPFFGGVMHSLDINNFAVDKGVHIFDSIPVDLGEIVTEIMEGHVHEIDFVSASAFNGVVTEGFSLPDLNSYSDQELKDQIRKELLELAANNGASTEPPTLEELFNNRYGRTASGVFCQIFKKVYGIEANEVEPTAIAQTSLGRLKFLDDPDMLELKQDPWLDTVLAARRKSMGAVDNFISLYPSDGQAMGGWCRRAQSWLERKGVKIRLGAKIKTVSESPETVTIEFEEGESITAEHLIWSNDAMNSLTKALGMDSDVDSLQYGTPMLFTTLFTEADNVRDFTYLQNFDPNQLTYRTAAAGRLSHQVKDGISFVTCECPTEIGNDTWNNPDSIAVDCWEEIKRLGIVSQDATLDSFDVKRIPTSFKIAKCGYGQAFKDLCIEVEKKFDRIILRDVVPFFRRDIYFDSKHLSELIS